MEIVELLRNRNFRFKKSLGQNFLTDAKLLEAIVSDAGITERDTVVEIGAGAGTLTSAIADKARKVYAFEIDRSLTPILAETLKGRENVEVVFRDMMKMRVSEFRELVPAPFQVVANLPYYITTPLLMRFVEEDLGAESVTVTVQKEVAERVAAKPGTPEFGAITLQIDLRGTARVTRQISRKLFYPVPNVDSAVLRVDLDRGKYPEADVSGASRLVKTAFAMRRKTLLNNLAAAYPAVSKDRLRETLVSLGFDEAVRGETLGTRDYLKLAEAFKTLEK